MANYPQQLEQLGVPPLTDNPSERGQDGILRHRLAHIFETVLPEEPYDFLHYYQLHAVALGCEGELAALRRVTHYPGTESPEVILNHIVEVALECYKEAWHRKHAGNPDAPPRIPEDIVKHLRRFLPFILLARSIRYSIMDDGLVSAGSTDEEERKKEKILGTKDPVDVLIEKIRAKSQEIAQ